MKWIYLVCFLTINNLYSQKITWQEDRKLTWDNFKSKSNNQQGKDVVAYTHCGWVYSAIKSTNPKSPVKIKLQAIFNEDKSWKSVNIVNDYILGHEQKHFDIAELFARKIRKEISTKIKTSGDFDKIFPGIYNRLLKEYRNFQSVYDKETKHGMNKEKQAVYDLLIANELENFKNYKDS